MSSSKRIRRTRKRVDRGRNKAVVKPFKVKIAKGRVAEAFVDDVDTVPTAMPTRHALALTVKAKIQAIEIPELAHRMLHIAEGGGVGAHWYGTLHAPMSASSWYYARSLERQDLIRSKLLLIQCLLLLLQSFNLILKSNLEDKTVRKTRRKEIMMRAILTCSAMIPVISPLSDFLWP